MRLRELLIPENLLAALRHKETRKLLIAKPNHGHYSLIDGDVFKNLSSYDQGFVDHKNNFMDRKAATLYAKKNNLITSKPDGDSERLHSYNIVTKAK